MTDKQFEALMDKLDRLTAAVSSLEETLAGLANDLTNDNEGDGYRLPEMIFGLARTIRDGA